MAAHYDGKARRADAEAFFKMPVTVGEEPDVVDATADVLESSFASEGVTELMN
jgi:hypothetical protein